MRRAASAACAAAVAVVAANPGASEFTALPVDAELPLLAPAALSSGIRAGSRAASAVTLETTGDLLGAARDSLQDPAAQCQWWFPDVGFEFDLSAISGKFSLQFTRWAEADARRLLRTHALPLHSHLPNSSMQDKLSLTPCQGRKSICFRFAAT